MKLKNLSQASTITLTAPFGATNTTQRMDMYHSHRKHVVIPDKPEIPIIDSSHAKSFNWSSENIKLAKITLLDKIEKIVDGVTTSTAYIYFDHEKNYVDVDIVTNYISSYMFGYRKTSQLKDVEIGETVENIYTSHLEAFDPVEEELAYGKNMNIIYNLGKEVLEDAIMISKEMSEELAVNYYYDIKFTLSKNQILRNIYSKEKGVYQPIPKVGQEIDKYTVASIINNASNLDILLMNNETTNTDTRYLTHGGRVVDIDVISSQTCKSQQLEQYRLDNLSFYSKLSNSLDSLETMYQLSSSALFIKNNNIDRIKSYRIKNKELKNNIYVSIKVVYRRPLNIGDKLTNRHGGKGTISKIMDKPLYADDGTKIDAMINVTGISNRENPGQMYECSMSSLNTFLQKYLKESEDSHNKKFDNIIKWLEAATLFKTANTMKEVITTDEEKKSIVEYYKDNFITMKFNPFNDDASFDEESKNKIRFDFKRFYTELFLFTDSLYEVKPFKIHEGQSVFSGEHFYGTVFYIVLENGPLKDTQIRSDGIYNTKGYISKKGEDKKSHQSLYGTTATKVSDLGLNIMLNSILPDRYIIILNSMKILNDYTIACGFHMKRYDISDNVQGG